MVRFIRAHGGTYRGRGCIECVCARARSPGQALWNSPKAEGTSAQAGHLPSGASERHGGRKPTISVFDLSRKVRGPGAPTVTPFGPCDRHVAARRRHRQVASHTPVVPYRPADGAVLGSLLSFYETI